MIDVRGTNAPLGRRLARLHDVRGRRLGTWAFLLNRLTGLLLVAYLYLHLGVLSLLARGPGSWHRFLSVAKSPFFLSLDVALILIILVHTLNGIRVIVVGSGLAVHRQKQLLWWAIGIGAAGLIYAALHILGGV
jgi:succinate dehydrogenase / fumarate reductase cytochrome b subunit